MAEVQTSGHGGFCSGETEEVGDGVTNIYKEVFLLGAICMFCGAIIYLWIEGDGRREGGIKRSHHNVLKGGKACVRR